MTPRVGGLYRFKANREVGFEVIKRFYVVEKDLWKLKISWVNIGTHAPWHMGIEQRIKLTSDKLKALESISYTFRIPAKEYDPIYY